MIPTGGFPFVRAWFRITAGMKVSLSLALIFGLMILTLAPARSESGPYPLTMNWGLFNTQSNSHIDVQNAWAIEKGNKSVRVAVIDTGVDSDNADLRNAVEPGFDTTSNEPFPVDEHGHGTHVAGIIRQIANVEIVPFKYYLDSNPGSVNLKLLVKAINAAVDSHVQIINYSGGGPEFCEEEYLALKRAQAAGILVVVAAGNEHSNSDLPEYYYYPAAYRLPNIISVAATDIQNELIRSSNWGETKVDLAAPGENILSDLPHGKRGFMTGTSQATAFVSGVAALILSHKPGLTPEQVKTIIMQSVDPIPGLAHKVASGGRLNAYHALMYTK